jgi:ribosome-binding factor A
MKSKADKDKGLEEELAHRAADFLNKESNRQSLVTVTRAVLSKDAREAQVLVTVLPVEHEHDVLSFLKRVRSDFREYLKRNAKLSRLPIIDFAIDHGEKNRQQLDELTRT